MFKNEFRENLSSSSKRINYRHKRITPCVLVMQSHAVTKERIPGARQQHQVHIIVNVSFGPRPYLERRTRQNKRSNAQTFGVVRPTLLHGNDEGCPRQAWAQKLSTPQLFGPTVTSKQAWSTQHGTSVSVLLMSRSVWQAWSNTTKLHSSLSTKTSSRPCQSSTSRKVFDGAASNAMASVRQGAQTNQALRKGVLGTSLGTCSWNSSLLTVHNCLRNVNVCEGKTDPPRTLVFRTTQRWMLGAQPSVLVPCPLDHNRWVIQSATVVLNSVPIFCICSDNQLCRKPISSDQALPVHFDGSLLPRNFQRCRHPPIPCHRAHLLIHFKKVAISSQVVDWSTTQSVPKYLTLEPRCNRTSPAEQNHNTSNP